MAKNLGFSAIQVASAPIPCIWITSMASRTWAGPGRGAWLTNTEWTASNRKIRAMAYRLLTSLLILGLAALPKAQGPDLAPFVPTPMDVVDRMLKLAAVGPDDTVYDLGSGDGRIVIAAAQKYGARGVGIEIDPKLIAKAEALATAAGVADRVKFLLEDAMSANLSGATVVTLYLLSASNVKLRPVLTKQLPRGARIVAHDFPIGDWEPTVVDNFTDITGRKRTLFLWNFDGVFRP